MSEGGLFKKLVAWLRRAMHRPAALPQPTRLRRQSRLLLRHAAEPRDEPEGLLVRTLDAILVEDFLGRG